MSLIKWAPFFLAGAALESFTQICLKKGAIAHGDADGISYYLKLLSNRWVIAGVLLYLVEMVIWIVLLTNIPLSIAFPITGVQKIFIILFSVAFLKETISRTEWIGFGITALGIAIIGQTG